MAFSNPLKNQTALTFAVRIGGVMLSVVAASLVARLLQPEKYGQYAFVLAIITMASILPTVGLRQTVIRETAYARAQNKDGHIAAVWVWAFRTALLAALVLAAVLVTWAHWGVKDAQFRSNLLIGVLLLFLLPVPQIMSGALQGLGRIVPSQLPEFTVRPLLMVVMLVSVWSFSQAGDVTVMLVLVFFAVAVVGEGLTGAFFLRRITGLNVRSRLSAQDEISSKRLTVSALSFGAIAGVGLINNNLDIIMLGTLEGGPGTGLYKAATALSALVSFGLVVVNTVIMPQVAALHSKGDRSVLQALLTRSAWLITLIAFVGAVSVFLGGQLLLRLLFGESYLGGYAALLVLACGQFANAFFGPVALILNMTGNERLTLIGVTLSVVSNAALNLLLIPRFGIAGAAIATATSLFLLNLSLAVALRWRTGFNSTIVQWRTQP